MTQTTGARASGRLLLRIVALLCSTSVAAFPLRQIASEWHGGSASTSMLAVLVVGCALVVAGLALAVSPRSGRGVLALAITAQLAYLFLAPTRWGGM